MQSLAFLLDNSYFVFTSGYELIYFIAVSWICKSGSALNTRFKRCFRIPTAISVLLRYRAAASTGVSFLHRLPYGFMITCLRSKAYVPERRCLMQEYLWVSGADMLIRSSYIQTASGLIYTMKYDHML